MTRLRTGIFVITAMLWAPALHAQEGISPEIMQGWLGSAHADATAEAFTHWNEEGEIPGVCAVCHASAGFLDFHGLDGTEAGSVDQTIAAGGVVDCATCHADGVSEIASITFPSGVTMPALENAATCMTCHQGRSSGPSLTERFGDADHDTPNAELRFVNPHYAAAAATTFGADVSGLYEYVDRNYAGPFEHAAAISTCTSCHDPHSLEVATEGCVACHGDAAPADIRVSQTDFDGDGDVTEGVAAEIDTLTGLLSAEITAYAAEVAGAAIVYAPNAYPYFFNDLDADGVVDPDEAMRENAYSSWTPRLLAAAYNYQFVRKDPGAYAHNPHYTLQALHDSIADLATASGRAVPDITRR